MNVFSAPAGTYLTHRDHGRLAVIVGFAYVQGNLAFPIFAVPTKSGVGPLEAIEHPDGAVSYPAKARTFESVTDWMSFVEDLDDETAEAKKPVEGTKPDDSPIKFGTKSNKTKSFWYWPTANAVFEIEGEAVLPDDKRVEKIKRDEFFNLKRDGAVKIDPHAGVIVEEGGTHPADEEDEDDDASVI